MSESSDALAAKVMAAVTRHTGVTKSSGQHAVLEAVVGGLCELIGHYEDHVDYTNRVLQAMNEPPGAIMPGPGPGRHQEPFTPDEWRMMRVKAGER